MKYICEVFSIHRFNFFENSTVLKCSPCSSKATKIEFGFIKVRALSYSFLYTFLFIFLVLKLILINSIV